ncbi:hypothetical protein [Mucilaginibacter sp.]|uniref:hypothetical protein n=1 Tax=Mucilaginibacter sp. TaxID=1882438 RepID=UPI00283ADE24|nr:hypothetical protein [Mucilaginibacter sp.]MDR3695146.1 hypothetical protein [Mucilaginibacter sp.]
MKTNLLIAIFLLPLIVSAQKLLKPDVDKISGDTTWSTSVEKLYFNGNYLTAQGEAVTFQVVKFSNANGLVLILNPQSLNMGEDLSIAKNHQAFLKLSDNSIITLISGANDYGNAVYTSIAHTPVQSSSTTAFYELPDAAIEKLKTLSLVFLRIETSEGNFDCDIKPKNAAKLVKAIELIQKAK